MGGEVRLGVFGRQNKKFVELIDRRQYLSTYLS